MKIAQQELRLITFLHYPPELAQDGLVVSVGRLIEGFSQRTGVSAKLEVAGISGRLPLAAKLCLFRVVQEALGNIHRHAAATTVAVLIEQVGSDVHLRVVDNGRGMTCDGSDVSASGLGIRSMRWRVEALGGEFRMESGPQGTSIFATISITEAGERDHEAEERLPQAVRPAQASGVSTRPVTDTFAAADPRPPAA